SFNVNRVKLWHYFGDTRQYHDVIVQLSNTEDFSSGVTTVFNNDTNNSAGQGAGVDNEYSETSAGKEIAFPTVNARYVRLWSNGSTANGSNHYVEVEIYKEDPITGKYFNIVNHTSGKCATNPGSSTSDGTIMVQSTCNGGTNQQWKFEPIGNGYYKVKNTASGKVLDNIGSTTNGTQI
ncbi:hypothetical protein GC102_28745, partial [Paenibacillus sp. LMG 31460]